MPAQAKLYDLTAANMLPQDPSGRDGHLMDDIANKEAGGLKVASIAVVQKPVNGREVPHLLVIYQS